MEVKKCEISQFHRDPRFKKVRLTFEKLFIKKGFSLTSKLASNVWFISKLKEFSLFIKNKDIGEPAYLQNLVDNDLLYLALLSFSKGNYRPVKARIIETFTLIVQEKLYVCDFISNLTELLLNSKSLIKKNSSAIINYNVAQQIGFIKEKVDYETKIGVDFESQKSVFKDKEYSQITFSLLELINFPVGSYSFKLRLKEFDSNLNLIKYSKPLLNSKKIRLIDDQNVVNLHQLNLTEDDITFHSIFAHILDQTKLQSYLSNHGNEIILKNNGFNFENLSAKAFASLNRSDQSTNTISSIKFSKSKSPEKRYAKSQTIDSFMLENTMKFQHKNNKNKSISMNRLSPEKIRKPQESSSTELNLSFAANDKVMTEFKFETNSSVKLYTFGLDIKVQDESFYEGEELLLDFIISHVNEIINNESGFKTQYVLHLKRADEFFQLDKYLSEQDPAVLMGVKLEYSRAVRHAILKRILLVFENFVSNLEKHQNLIENSLKKHFCEIEEEISNHLIEEDDIKKGYCCPTSQYCLLF